jgi:hypothetical protein
LLLKVRGNLEDSLVEEANDEDVAQKTFDAEI